MIQNAYTMMFNQPPNHNQPNPKNHLRVRILPSLFTLPECPATETTGHRSKQRPVRRHRSGSTSPTSRTSCTRTRPSTARRRSAAPRPPGGSAFGVRDALFRTETTGGVAWEVPLSLDTPTQCINTLCFFCNLYAFLGGCVSHTHSEVIREVDGMGWPV